MAPGFAKAPLTKILCVLSLGASVLAGFTKSPHLFNLDIHNTFGRLQLWRLVTSQFVFATPTEIVFGIFLLFTFREFERRFKTSKFLAAVSVLIFLSTTFQIILLLLKVTTKVASGPYAVIFGLFIHFFSEIPTSVRGGLLFIPITDKTFTYAFGLQLMFAQYPPSCFSALCGLFAAVLYRAPWLPFQRIHLPASCVRWCSQTLAKLNATSSRRQRRGGYHPVPPVDENMPQQLFGAPVIPVVPADPARVQTLMDMGFPAERARDALSRTDNNLEAAVGMLGTAW